MRPRVRRGLHYCVLDRAVVLLDLPQDRYFMLTDIAGERFIAFLDNRAGPSALAALLADGIIENRNDAPEERCLVPSPSASLFDDDGPPAPRRLVARAIVAQIAARRALRTRSLARIIDDLALAKSAAVQLRFW